MKRQLGFPEIEPSRQGQAPGGLTGVVEQGPEHHPVVGPHGGSSIGTAGGIFVEGAGSPDVRAIAMDLGVIDGRDMIAVPEPPGGGLDQPGQAGGDVVGVPGAVLGEKDSGAFQSAGRSRARTDWVMVCSSPLMAMAVTHSANRRKLGPVKAQAKADSRACQIDQSRLA